MTITNHDEAVYVLKRAKGGDISAQHDLIVYIRDSYMGRRIGRYIHKNRIVDDDDLRQEFLIGVGLSIDKCRVDIGDPIEYLIARGVYRVRAYLRGQIIKNTIQKCNECGYITRMNRIDSNYICKKCGSNNVITNEINDHNEIMLNNAEDESISIEDEVLSEMIMESFERTLQEGSNVYNLYMLLKQGINRDNPSINNYIEEIAKMWGGCSEQNVVQTLNKLQNRIIKFAHDNDMEIIGYRFVERCVI